MSRLPPAPTLPPGGLAGWGQSRRLVHEAHLLAEAVEVEQRLQVRALPLGCHVEVGQLSLEGPLGEGEGRQLRELRSSCLPGSSGCSFQLGRLLGQLQATAVLGLSGERGCLCSSSLSVGLPQKSGTSRCPTAEF